MKSRLILLVLLAVLGLCPDGGNSWTQTAGSISVVTSWWVFGFPWPAVHYQTLRVEGSGAGDAGAARAAVRQAADIMRKATNTCGFARASFEGGASLAAADSFERGATSSCYLSLPALMGNWLVLFGLAGTVWWCVRLAQRARIMRRLRRGLCPACGYDTQGLPQEGRGPECGIALIRLPGD